MDLEAVLKEFVRRERQLIDESKDRMQREGLGYSKLGRMRQRVAKEMGFPQQDETLPYLIDQLLNMLFHSANVAEAAPAPAESPVTPVVAEAPAAPAAEEEALAMAPWIDSANCTSCDECININRKLFAYDDQKKAHIANPKAGTFREIVLAAERCPAAVIHPGTPLNPKEKNLDEWIARAERFN